MADISVIHYGARDADGNRSAPTDGGTLTGCAVAPTETQDTKERATDAAYERLTVYCPDPDADVQSSSVLIYLGNNYDVDGFPARWENPFTGARPGCVIEMSRQVG